MQTMHAMENCESLRGKKIWHKWYDNGTERLFTGQILDVVSGANDWFNIQHDGEDQNLILSIKTLRMVIWTLHFYRELYPPMGGY